jgi:hypothetical protein
MEQEQQYYIVNEWNTNSSGDSNSNLYLFNSLEDALEYYNNVLIHHNSDLNSSRNVLRFSSRTEMTTYFRNKVFGYRNYGAFDEDWAYSETDNNSGMYICEINEVENDLLVYKEKKTYGDWKRHCGIILTKFRSNQKTIENNSLGMIEMSIP